jgi:hypothetical protein
MLRPLYLQGKSPQYPSDRRMGEMENRSGRLGENFCLFQDFNFDYIAIQPRT